ncbi:MAG: glycine--tRNA ligase subunit beta [Candidatus Omnitrophica bacterium]|nr:glycine--tRNA ligase subunit beta [Candidatus Omnitrophota bacterium]
MDTKNLLIEIGCEDLPSWTGESFVHQFKNSFRTFIENRKLRFDDINVFWTPRRIVLFVKGIPEKTPAEKKEITGPRLNIIKDENGHYHPAIMKFAQAYNIQPENLMIKEAGDKKAVYFLKETAPVPVKNIIGEAVMEIIKNLNIPKSMKWDNSGLKFYRPVRWLFSLWDNEKISMHMGDVKSSCFTYGHRLISPGKIQVKHWKDYFDVIQKNFVIIDREVRKKFISALVKEKIQTEENVDETLFENLAELVEYPVLLRCKFPSDVPYIPDEIVKIIIEKAEGIPLYKNKILCREFLIVSDGIDNPDCIRNYEKLIRDRIMDAVFFYNNDLQKNPGTFIEITKKILFHPQWGSLYQRTERLCTIAKKISDILSLNESSSKNLCRAAELSKFDMASSVVREFPQLSGTMGKIYAKKWDENETVCQAIEDHLRPKFPGDSLPVSYEGSILAIIDRLEYVCTFISSNAEISGSEDPYGLKRIGNTLFDIIWAKKYNIELTPLIHETVDAFKLKNPSGTEKNIRGFIIQRLEAQLGFEGIPKGVRAGIISVENLNVYRIREKANAFSRFIGTVEGAENIFVPFSRMANILKQAKSHNIINWYFDEKLLVEKEEKNLFEIFKSNEDKVKAFIEKEEYLLFLNKLLDFKKPVDDFFDKVLVMCPEENIRNNRLAFLEKMNNMFLFFADFSFIREEDIKNARKI